MLPWNTHFMKSYENISRCILTLSILFFQKRLFSFIIQNVYFRTTTLIQNWNFLITPDLACGSDFMWICQGLFIFLCQPILPGQSILNL